MSDTVYDHTGFITPSLEGSVRFWSEVMGFEPKPIAERSAPWVAAFTGVPGATIRLCHLFGHGAHLEFIEFAGGQGEQMAPAGNQIAAGHVCLKFADLQAIHDRIIAAGGSSIGTIAEITEGPAAGIRGLYMRDPYGVIIELLELKSA